MSENSFSIIAIMIQTAVLLALISWSAQTLIREGGLPMAEIARLTGFASPGYFSTPMPAVLIYILSPRPRSTTLVSPVTTDTPAFLHWAAMETTIRSSSLRAQPSSIIKEQLR